MTGVLVVEDQQELAAGLEAAIGTQPDIESLGTAGTVGAALEKMAGHVPDVVLVDIALPGGDGIEGTRRIKAAYPEVSVLVLTAGPTLGRLAAAAAAGAVGFLSKDSSFPDILAAIRNPIGGKVVIEGPAITPFIHAVCSVPPQGGAPAAQPGSVPDWARLTAREEEVLALMGEGLDPRAIAERLVVSRHTARGHVKNVMMKLGAHTQLEAVIVATRSGLLPAKVPPQRPARPPEYPPDPGRPR
jgi:DNA-binding NarL/FixJ family response regulator